MRITWLFFLSVITGVTAARADCEYRPEWRGRDTVSYVRDAEACLAELKEGFWVDAAVEREVFERVNAVRVQAGLAPLQLRTGLLRPARLHSFDMGQDWFFDHEGPDGRSVSQRVSALDRTLVQSEIRENIAQIKGDFDWSETGDVLHNTLFNSPRHRENMLAPRLTHMAMGVVRSKKGAWITQIFVREAGELTVPAPLALRPSQLNLPKAELHDWSFQEMRLKLDDVEYTLETLGPNTRGEADLLIVGTRPVDARTYKIINLAGPSVTLIGPDPS